MSDVFTIASIAWRNLRRNRRRTVLTLITLIAGCGMIIFNNAIFNGGTGQMIEDAVALNSGHLQIHEKGFLDSGTIDYAFIPAPSLLDKLSKMKEQGMVAGFSPRIEVNAMVSSGDVTEGAVIQGLDLPGADGVISIHEKILPGGKLPAPGDHRSVLVGRVLAENLGILPGSAFTMISQAFDGSIAAERLTAAGIIKTGNPLMDSTLILMPHDGVRETFAMGDFIHSLVVRLTPGTDPTQAARVLRAAAGDDALEFTTWERLIPDVAQFVVLDNIVGYVFSFILYIVVAFTVLNTIQMAVFERTREFGVLLSIGTTPWRIFSMIMLESLFITLIGVALGVLLGLGISAIVERHPFDYSRWADEFAAWGVYTTVYPAKATALNVVITSLLTFLLASLFSLLPARRAMKLKPVEAMRHQ